MNRNNQSSLSQFFRNGDASYWCSLATVAILPLYVYYIPPFMILWGVVWLIERRFKPDLSLSFNKPSIVLFWVFIALFIWQTIGLLYIQDTSSGIDRLLKRLSLLLFPLVLSDPGEKILKNLRTILKVFVLFTIIYIVYRLAQALFNSLSVVDSILVFNPHPADYDYENYFIADRFTNPLHPSYVAAYVVISLIICVEEIFSRNNRLSIRGLWVFITVFLLFSLYLLSSRAGFLAALVILPLQIFLKLRSRISRIIAVLIPVCLILLLFFIARNNNRINYFLEDLASDNVQKVLQNDIRYTIWKSAFMIASENLVLGVGTGDASQELKREFIERGYIKGFYDNLNAHNQFLEILLENGIIGLTLFLLIFAYLSWISVKQSNLLLALGLIMFFVFFLFESTLNRLAGVTFFPFMLFLLLHLKDNDPLK